MYDLTLLNLTVVTLDLGKGRTPAYQTNAVHKIIAKHPTLKIVIAHLAQPPLANPEDQELDRLWEKQILLGGIRTSGSIRRRCRLDS